jgi:hypothetical protein
MIGNEKQDRPSLIRLILKGEVKVAKPLQTLSHAEERNFAPQDPPIDTRPTERTIESALSYIPKEGTSLKTGGVSRRPLSSQTTEHTHISDWVKNARAKRLPGNVYGGGTRGNS